MNGRAHLKDTSHQKIRLTASRMLRAEGMSATSVHGVMGRSGLTVGGFYAHFDSREDLVRDAFEQAVRQRREFVRGLLAAERPSEWMRVFMRSYLSAEHAADRENGCAWAALLSDLPRADTGTRRSAERLFESSVRYLAGSLRDEPPGSVPTRRRGAKSIVRKETLSSREVALSSLALAFAHLDLARMVVSPRLRKEILATGIKAAAALAACREEARTEGKRK